MRTWILALSLSVAVGFAQRQLVPVPDDPHELAKGPVQVLNTAAERGALVSLINRSAVSFAFHARGAAPYVFKASFTASNVFADQGQGSIEEDWANGQQWRWAQSLGGYLELRIFSQGIAYTTRRAPMPMALQTLRTALFNPVRGFGVNMPMRSFTAAWNGSEVTCGLFGGFRGNDAAAAGRHWNDNEYCVDSKTALLQIYSDAPGIYVVYDYTGATQFHSRTIPSKVSVFENGAEVISARISVTDGDFSNSTLFTPTEQMVAGGPGAMTTPPERMPMLIPKSANESGAPVQPTIVQATIDSTGKVIDAVALQSSAVSAAAVEEVKRADMGVTSGPGQVPHQRQAFINVQFVPGMLARQ